MPIAPVTAPVVSTILVTTFPTGFVKIISVASATFLATSVIVLLRFPFIVSKIPDVVSLITHNIFVGWREQNVGLMHDGSVG